jgi:hypothetical protein
MNTCTVKLHYAVQSNLLIRKYFYNLLITRFLFYSSPLRFMFIYNSTFRNALLLSSNLIFQETKKNLAFQLFN